MTFNSWKAFNHKIIGMINQGENKFSAQASIKYYCIPIFFIHVVSRYDGGKLLELVQESIHVPSFNMQQVEDIHVLVSHLLTSMIREEQKKAI